MTNGSKSLEENTHVFSNQTFISNNRKEKNHGYPHSLGGRIGGRLDFAHLAMAERFCLCRERRPDARSMLAGKLNAAGNLCYVREIKSLA